VRSPAARILLETLFVILVALGVALAGFDLPAALLAIAIVVVAVTVIELTRTRPPSTAEPEEEPRVAAVPDARPEPTRPAAEPATAPAAAVSERSARALLATATPPLPGAPTKAKAETGAPAEPAAEPAGPGEPPREPEPVLPSVPTASAAIPERAQPPEPPAPREWNVWELERAVRATDEQNEEWAALLIHLREYANAEGDLPIQFDELVRESFGEVLMRQAEPATS
jgi:hypothetical protein